MAAATPAQKAARARFAAAARAAGGRVRNAARRTTSKAKGFLVDIDIPEAALFGLGGYFLSDVLLKTGVNQYLASKSPAFNAWQNGVANANADPWGCKATSKLIGLGAFAYEANEARRHKLSVAQKSSILPFALGAMIDAPGEGGMSGWASPAGSGVPAGAGGWL